MHSSFYIENEHANLQLAQYCMEGQIQVFKVSFKQNMTCLKSCMKQSKELFIALITHLTDYNIRGKIAVEIVFNQFNDSVKEEKTATYSSSSYIPWIIDAGRFYNEAVNRMVGSYKQHLCKKSNVEIIKIRCIIIQLGLSSKKKKNISLKKQRAMNMTQKMYRAYKRPRMSNIQLQRNTLNTSSLKES